MKRTLASIVVLLTKPAVRSGSTRRFRAVRVAAVVMAVASLTADQPKESGQGFIVGPRVSTGARITPMAAPGSTFETLDPQVAADPTIRANQGVTTTTRSHAARSNERLELLGPMEGQDFNREDNLDTARFNRALWVGLMGENVPYPTERHGRDLSRNRRALLKAADVAADRGQ